DRAPPVAGRLDSRGAGRARGVRGRPVRLGGPRPSLVRAGQLRRGRDLDGRRRDRRPGRVYPASGGVVAYQPVGRVRHTEGQGPGTPLQDRV
ncbi:MAG: hypothetical protein AVDCRST_MAG12-2775, partial [uncultured Rubrobacteraceae bacterium]